VVTLAEIQSQVASLPEEDRASLASFILETLDSPDYDVSDEALALRTREIKGGSVSPISMEELRKRVMNDLG
jgi:hypothetical protein